MKILLLGEYSGLNKELKNALKILGHEVTLAASNDFWKKIPVDINLGYGENIFSYKMRQFILPFLNLDKLSGYDIVHVVNFYIFPRSLYLNLWLIKFLKKNNGLVSLSGAGDDPFFVKFSSETMRYNPIPSHEKYDRGGRKYYMRSDKHLSYYSEYMKYVDVVIPIMYEYYSTFNAAGFQNKTKEPIPIPIDCGNIKYKRQEITGNEKIVFFHGLNRPGFKGTFLIERAFERLEEKHGDSVDCLIRGKMPFDEYMKTLGRMNVVVDQAFSYSLAMNALYSMAHGKVVCGGVEPESLIIYNGSKPPAFNIKPSIEDMLEVFDEIIDHRDEINDLSEKSRAFVEKFHNPILVAEKYIEKWDEIL